MHKATFKELILSVYTWRNPRKKCKIEKKWILRCKKVQTTASTTSKEQKHNLHRDNVFCFLKIYGFYGFCCILETEELFL